jgi:hypothetical protein
MDVSDQDCGCSLDTRREALSPDSTTAHWAVRQDGLLFVLVDRVLDVGVYKTICRELDANAGVIDHVLIDCEDVGMVHDSGLAALTGIDAIARSKRFDLSVLDAPESVREHIASSCKAAVCLE